MPEDTVPEAQRLRARCLRARRLNGREHVISLAAKAAQAAPAVGRLTPVRHNEAWYYCL